MYIYIYNLTSDFFVFIVTGRRIVFICNFIYIVSGLMFAINKVGDHEIYQNQK